MKQIKRIEREIELNKGNINNNVEKLVIKNAINDLIDSIGYGGNYQITVGEIKKQETNYKVNIAIDYFEEAEEIISVKSNDCGDKIIAYVDGSFDKDKKLCGSGVVFLKSLDDETPLDILSFSTMDKYNMWNIQGECESCLVAIQRAIKMKYKRIDIYYDYQGISSWALREWKAKNDYTQKYVERFNELNKFIEVEFHKVKGHSKDKWNDEADRLAKASLGK